MNAESKSLHYYLIEAIRHARCVHMSLMFQQRGLYGQLVEGA